MENLISNTHKARWCVSSPEEAWVKSCAAFFEKYGSFDWFLCDFREAYAFIMKHGRGIHNPIYI